MKPTNFHTHTARCLHAVGTDEQYVLAALGAGYRQLGFSDHTPWPYRDSFVSTCRMTLPELPGYVASVRSMKEKYRGQIEIFLGMEVEHFPEFSSWLLDTRAKHNMDYLIFGNHNDLLNEEVYFGVVNQKQHVIRYGKKALAGLSSGLYDCFAHPDLFLQAYPRFDAECKAVSLDIVQAARDQGMVLEYNISGFYNQTRRQGGLGYPYEGFWELAAQQGCSVIIGVDAHSPERLSDIHLIELAQTHVKSLGLHLVHSLVDPRTPAASIA